MTGHELPDDVKLAAFVLVKRGRAVDLEPHQARNACVNVANNSTVAKAFYDVARERWAGDSAVAASVQVAYNLIRVFHAHRAMTGGSEAS